MKGGGRKEGLPSPRCRRPGASARPNVNVHNMHACLTSLERGLGYV